MIYGTAGLAGEAGVDVVLVEAGVVGGLGDSVDLLTVGESVLISRGQVRTLCPGLRQLVQHRVGHGVCDITQEQKLNAKAKKSK